MRVLYRLVAGLIGSIVLAGVLLSPPSVSARLPTTPTVDHDKSPYARAMTLYFYAIPDPADTRIVWITCDGGDHQSDPYPFADQVHVSLDLPGCEGYGVKTVGVQVEEADGTPVFWGQVNPGIAARMTLLRPLPAITGETYTFDPEYPADYDLPAGATCLWEFRWGNDRSLDLNEADETFGALGFETSQVDGDCPTWTFSLPWVPYRQFEVSVRVGLLEDGERAYGNGARVRFMAEEGGTERRITSSSLPVAQVLPSTYTPIVGQSVTYTRYLIGGATPGSDNRWTAWQGSGDTPNMWHQDGGSTFTIAPHEPGNVLVSWQRMSERLFYAMYDPPVRYRDRTRPTATVPAQQVGSGAVGGTVPVRLSWDGSDTGWGIAKFQLERSVDGGAWRRVLSAKVRSTTQPLEPGRRYRFRVRAVDKAGNVGAWRVGSSFRPGIREDGTGAAAYHGGWTLVEDVTARGGSLREATTAGAWVRLAFTGRAAAWIAERGPGHGRARVYVDGRRVATVDLSATTDAAARVVFRTHWAARGSHTLRIEVLGTAGRPTVGVDGFVILR